jgi:hypothetical protein
MEKKWLSKWVLTQSPLIEIHVYDCVYLRASMFSFNQVLCIVLSVVSPCDIDANFCSLIFTLNLVVTN